jgi:hypothetical protein
MAEEQEEDHPGIGPKTLRRRRIHLIRLVFWGINAPLAVWMVVNLSESVYLPYLVLISVAANIEGAWSSYAADSPTEQ